MVVTLVNFLTSQDHLIKH